MVKNVFLYVMALVVLLAPAIILGWIGWSLLDWPGLIIGIIAGLAIFAFSMNKVISQEATLTDENSENSAPVALEEMKESVKQE
jgi:hypothetical protein